MVETLVDIAIIWLAVSFLAGGTWGAIGARMERRKRSDTEATSAKLNAAHSHAITNH